MSTFAGLSRITAQREINAAAYAVANSTSQEDDWEVVRASDLGRLRAALASFKEIVNAPRPKCEPGHHRPVFRGILGGFYCAKCPCFDYEGDGNWMTPDEWHAQAVAAIQEEEAGE